jgi:hypothetical protein
VAEKIFAALVLACCAVLMLRLLLGERRRGGFDAFWRRVWIRLRIQALRLWHWPAARRRAKRDAEAAIRRAREGTWDGNVYKPKSFDKRKLH